MSGLFASGRIIDLVLLLTLIEGLVLAAHRRRTGRGLPLPALLATLAPGICLMLAVRGALVGAWWGWIATCLAASFVTHVGDLRSRWHH